MKPREFKGDAYFPTFIEARDFGAKHGKGWPAWRVVAYTRGWAVQAYPSGPYFNLAGELPDYAATSRFNPAINDDGGPSDHHDCDNGWTIA